METKNLFITIVMPALNEEENILQALDNTLSSLKEFDLKGEIIVVDDGSTDSTPLLVQDKIKEYPSIIRMISHNTPKGIGASFWDGADDAKGDVVCMLPGDNENEPGEILRYLDLLGEVDIVVPFVFHKKDRSFFRNALSFVYRFIINNTFLLSLNYTNGTVLYRKSILLNEIKHRSKGFFYQTDILVRLVTRGYLFVEVPYRLRRRKKGRPKALSFCSFCEVIEGYLRLVRDIYFRKEKKTLGFNPDSVSRRRYSEIEELNK